MQPNPDHVKCAGDQPSGQPYLHDLATAVYAPGVVLSDIDGQITAGAHGAFWGDRRLLSVLAITADGAAPVGVATSAPATGNIRFLGILRELGDGGPDPTVTLQRDRSLVDSGLVETVTLASSGREPVSVSIRVDTACDLADMAAVKSGRPIAALPAQRSDSGLHWVGPDGSTVRLAADPAPDAVDGTTLSWRIRLERGERRSIVLRADLSGAPDAVVHAAPSGLGLAGFELRCDDQRLTRLTAQSLTDLDSLCLVDPLDPDDRFLAAGAPWFLTLFGRDAIWAARMLLPLGTSIAAGTLRALARRQGTVVDPASAQEPGKIMHEIRPVEHHHDAHDVRLPPLYYGTVDATALWVSLLHDAWRWGMPVDQVAELLPATERAVDWIIDHGSGDSGFVSYRDETGTGLANQGWKDSGDSVQFRDGALAAPPIALCEVQGYAYAAARQAAELFDAFGLGGDRAERWRGWAADLADGFRAAFWIDDPAGRYPAIALDADGKQVDTVTSNIAHLLGTGLLNADEERQVVARLARPDMDSGFGLRTMSTDSAGFNPLAYHGGSVWTHDTAIALLGLAASDAPAASTVAASLARGLLAAASCFDFRMPELFGGHARDDFATAVPYPAACRPQAWSAASSVAIMSALLGLRPDAPNGTVHLRPVRPSPVGAMDLRGLRLGATAFDVVVDADGYPVVRGLPREVRVLVD